MNRQQDRNNGPEEPPINLESIACLPPEVWEHVFSFLIDFRDRVNVSNASTYWRNVQASTKSSWLFGLVFPSLLEHLPRQDLLNCRLVCQSWRFGLDFFMEHSAYHRPGSQQHPILSSDNPSPGEYHSSTQFYNSDHRLRPLKLLLFRMSLDYNNFYDTDKMSKLLAQAVTHPRCPFIGKSADIAEINTQFSPVTGHFLNSFGHHFLFLRIGVQNLPPVATLARILTVIFTTRHIKKLELYIIVGSHRRHLWKGKTDEDTQISQELVQCLEDWQGLPENREGSWNLETIRLSVQGVGSDTITKLLLEQFASEHLKSLTLNNMPSGSFQERLGNLTDLSLRIDGDNHFEDLLKMKCSLRRLFVVISGSTNLELVFQFVLNFRKSLRSLGLDITREFFQPSESLAERLKLFRKLTALNNLGQVRTAILGSCRPISVDFLCGLCKSLEYWHVSMSEVNAWAEFLTEQEDPGAGGKLDLPEYLVGLSAANKWKVYESNVWKVFPKLRVLTVQICLGESRNEEEWEYRRDIYEKFQSQN